MEEIDHSTEQVTEDNEMETDAANEDEPNIEDMERSEGETNKH